MTNKILILILISIPLCNATEDWRQSSPTPISALTLSLSKIEKTVSNTSTNPAQITLMKRDERMRLIKKLIEEGEAPQLTKKFESLKDIIKGQISKLQNDVNRAHEQLLALDQQRQELKKATENPQESPNESIGMIAYKYLRQQENQVPEISYLLFRIHQEKQSLGKVKGELDLNMKKLKRCESILRQINWKSKKTKLALSQ